MYYRKVNDLFKKFLNYWNFKDIKLHKNENIVTNYGGILSCLFSLFRENATFMKPLNHFYQIFLEP